jgi:hypothetical protein
MTQIMLQAYSIDHDGASLLPTYVSPANNVEAIKYCRLFMVPAALSLRVSDLCYKVEVLLPACLARQSIWIHNTLQDGLANLFGYYWNRVPNALSLFNLKR